MMQRFSLKALMRRIAAGRRAHAQELENISHAQVLRKFGYVPDEALFRVRREDRVPIPKKEAAE